MIVRGGTDPIMMFDFFIRQPSARILQDYFVKNHYRVRGAGRRFHKSSNGKCH